MPLRILGSLLVLAPLSLTVVSAAQVHPTQPGGVFCRADLDRNLVVDAADLGALLSDWGGTEYDLDGSGATDGADIGVFLTQWGRTCHPFHDNVTVSIEGGFLVVESNGLPTHATGNFPGACGNPNSMTAQDDEWMLPIEPEETSSPAVDAMVQLGPIGVMVNGVAFYNPYDGGGVTAPDTICMDLCQAHPSPDGRYHYHQFSACIDPYSGGHSAIVGFAFDGLPVYGPWESDGQLAALLSGKRALDGCNGHWDPDRGYHYHSISYDQALEFGVAEDGFPWILGCFKAEPEASNFQGGGPPGGGGGGCDGCAGSMIPPQVCHCVRNRPGYAYCCENWDAACAAIASTACGG